MFVEMERRRVERRGPPNLGAQIRVVYELLTLDVRRNVGDGPSDVDTRFDLTHR